MTRGTMNTREAVLQAGSAGISSSSVGDQLPYKIDVARLACGRLTARQRPILSGVDMRLKRTYASLIFASCIHSRVHTPNMADPMKKYACISGFFDGKIGAHWGKGYWMTTIVSISVGFQSIAWDRFRLFTPMKKGVLFCYVELAMLCELEPPDKRLIRCSRAPVITRKRANEGEYYFSSFSMQNRVSNASKDIASDRIIL